MSDDGNLTLFVVIVLVNTVTMIFTLVAAMRRPIVSHRMIGAVAIAPSPRIVPQPIGTWREQVTINAPRQSLEKRAPTDPAGARRVEERELTDGTDGAPELEDDTEDELEVEDEP